MLSLVMNDHYCLHFKFVLKLKGCDTALFYIYVDAREIKKCLTVIEHILLMLMFILSVGS